jgi:hypothetical protein
MRPASKRGKVVHIRFTDEEHRKLKTLAAFYRVDIGRMVTMALEGAFPELMAAMEQASGQDDGEGAT